MTNAKRILDKYSVMIYRVRFVLSIFPDAKFLFLVRNGWDVVQSISLMSNQMSLISGANIENWWGVNNRKWLLIISEIVNGNPLFDSATVDQIELFKNEIDMAAVEWITSMQEGRKLQREFPNKVLELKFEDLTQDTEKQINRILEFCDLPEDEILVQYSKRVLKKVPFKGEIRLHQSINVLFREFIDIMAY